MITRIFCRTLVGPLLLLAFLLGRADAREAKLGQIYNRSAQDHGPARNPVILIPGILGSTLKEKDTGEIVWGGFTHHYANPGTAAGARLFALPMHPGTPLSGLRDDVVPTGALSELRLSLFGIPVELHAYREILLSLGIGGFADETLGRNGEINYGTDHFTCFQFPYDWRRDLTENAALLHEFILEKRKFVQAQLAKRYGAKNVDVHFDLIAHSMGGLVARYYLEYGGEPLPANGSLPAVTWTGARYVDRAIFVSPPNAGAMKSITDLAAGVGSPSSCQNTDRQFSGHSRPFTRCCLARVIDLSSIPARGSRSISSIPKYGKSTGGDLPIRETIRSCANFCPM